MKYLTIICILIFSINGFCQHSSHTYPEHFYDVQFYKFSKGVSTNEGPLSPIILMKKRIFKDHIIFKGSKIDIYTESNNMNNFLAIPYDLYIPKGFYLNGNTKQMTKEIKRKALLYPNIDDYPYYISLEDNYFHKKSFNSNSDIVKPSTYKKLEKCMKYLSSIESCIKIDSIKKDNSWYPIIGRLGCSPRNLTFSDSEKLIDSELVYLKKGDVYYLPIPAAMHYENFNVNNPCQHKKTIIESRVIYYVTKCKNDLEEILKIQRANDFDARIGFENCPFVDPLDENLLVTNMITLYYRNEPK